LTSTGNIVVHYKVHNTLDTQSNLAFDKLQVARLSREPLFFATGEKA
jgi:hypothetical protein